jgi:hypothetical protein
MPCIVSLCWGFSEKDFEQVLSALNYFDWDEDNEISAYDIHGCDVLTSDYQAPDDITRKIVKRKRLN